jgi:membrane fusion protein (multidrug efflux system)
VLVLQAEGPLEVAVDVPEAELEPLLASASSDLSVRFPGHDPTFAAEVDAHRSRPDRATRTYRVEVLVASPPEGIAPGMTAELRWSRPSGPERLTIPLSAVSSRPDGTPVVYLVEDGALRSAEVRLGPVEGDRVVVLEGVSAGETLLVAGLAAAEDGLAVRPMGPEDLGG